MLFSGAESSKSCLWTQSYHIRVLGVVRMCWVTTDSCKMYVILNANFFFFSKYCALNFWPHARHMWATDAKSWSRRHSIPTNGHVNSLRHKRYLKGLQLICKNHSRVILVFLIRTVWWWKFRLQNIQTAGCVKSGLLGLRMWLSWNSFRSDSFERRILENGRSPFDLREGLKRHRNTGCFKKSFTTLKAYRNLYRGHTQRFELSKCSETHRVLLRWLSWTSNEALPKLFHCSVRNTWPTGWLGMVLAVAVLGTTVPRAWKVSCNSCE